MGSLVAKISPSKSPQDRHTKYIKVEDDSDTSSQTPEDPEEHHGQEESFQDIIQALRQAQDSTTPANDLPDSPDNDTDRHL
jgi:hypothetical protein